MYDNHSDSDHSHSFHLLELVVACVLRSREGWFVLSTEKRCITADKGRRSRFCGPFV